MEKGNPIIIRKVKNGYIVEPDARHGDTNYICYSDVMVFNDIGELNNFLVEHFE